MINVPARTQSSIDFEEVSSPTKKSEKTMNQNIADVMKIINFPTTSDGREIVICVFSGKFLKVNMM